MSTITLALDTSDAERAHHLAMLVAAAEQARAEAVAVAVTTTDAAERDHNTTAAARHQRERDVSARELGQLLAPHLAPPPARPNPPRM